MLEQQAEAGNFLYKIFFSDEAHFAFGEQVIKQNCRIWGSKNPHIIEERLLYLEKITVWCALWSECMIGPYFFENDNGTIITVNWERYGHMITAFFFACY